MSQELITKHNFEKFNTVEDIEWYDDEIYCSGYTFNTKINDGNATDAYLIRYDNNLILYGHLKLVKNTPILFIHLKGIIIRFMLW